MPLLSHSLPLPPKFNQRLNTNDVRLSTDPKPFRSSSSLTQLAQYRAQQNSTTIQNFNPNVVRKYFDRKECLHKSAFFIIFPPQNNTQASGSSQRTPPPRNRGPQSRHPHLRPHPRQKGRMDPSQHPENSQRHPVHASGYL